MPARGQTENARRAGRQCAIALLTIGCLFAGAVSASGSTGGPVFSRLSNLHTSTRWAYPTEEAEIRSQPSGHSRPIGRLRFLTIDNQAELYVVLASARLASGAVWLQIEVPARPNGQVGWVPSGALGTLQLNDSYLRVNQQKLTVTLFRKGREIFQAPVGVGKPSTVTPDGHFYVLEKLRAVDAPIYGPFALGTSAYAPTLTEWPGGGVVGIHGTNEPQLIPGRPSHGCVRLRDAEIARLWPLVELGTPIEII